MLLIHLQIVLGPVVISDCPWTYLRIFIASFLPLFSQSIRQLIQASRTLESSQSFSAAQVKRISLNHRPQGRG